MSEITPDIRYLDRQEIDMDKWDQCIHQASNGLIYARSYYLDSMAKKWSGLIWNDYEAVMPLTWNRKYGISYLYQPAFTAQLGVFFKNLPDNSVFEHFIQHAKSLFRFCEINLNFDNPPIQDSMRANFILDLNKSYDEIRNGYKKRLLKNIQEAETALVQYHVSDNFEMVARLFKTHYGKRLPNLKNADYEHFENLCRVMQDRKMIIVRYVKDTAGEILSASIFFRDQHRIYYILSVTLPAGRKKKAQFHLLNQLIMEFAGEKLLFDFEGSAIPGIAEFFSIFGSYNQPYPFLKYNHLPFPFRFFK